MFAGQWKVRYSTRVKVWHLLVICIAVCFATKRTVPRAVVIGLALFLL